MSASEAGSLPCDGGAGATKTGGGLEGVGQLQHLEVGLVAADDLHADRETVGGEAAGGRRSRAGR